jgi:hypothetical protein
MFDRNAGIFALESFKQLSPEIGLLFAVWRFPEQNRFPRGWGGGFSFGLLYGPMIAGYMRMLTMSHRFVIPVQAHKFEATALKQV